MTFEIERIGSATLYRADCLDVLPTLGPVDALVMDPPYLFRTEGAGHFRKNRTHTANIQDAGLNKGFDIRIIDSLQFQSVVTFCHNDQLPEILTHVKGQFHRFCLGFWHKTNPMPVANKHYQPDTEIYVHAWNKGAHPIGDLKDKGRYWMGPVGRQAQFNHPTVKPIALMEKIIGNVNAGTVLDCFMGTGTTGVACAALGRNFIGIEKTNEHFDTACDRLRKAYEGAPVERMAS